MASRGRWRHTSIPVTGLLWKPLYKYSKNISLFSFSSARSVIWGNNSFRNIVVMSLLASEIASRSSFALIAMPVTAAARYSVVAHLRTSYSFSSSKFMPCSFLIHRQNFPWLLPRMNPFENVQMAVIIILSCPTSLNTFWYSCLTS